jgi:hypothetical protein
MLMANTSWYLWNFRRKLADAIIGQGYNVLFAAPRDAYSDRLGTIGQFVDVPMSRSGMHPIRELRTILAFRSVLRR